MKEFSLGSGGRLPQDRHTVARWRPLSSLRVRLAVLVAVVVTAVVGGAAYLETRVFEMTVLRELTETVHRTAQAVADEIELRSEELTEDDLADTLREFAEAIPPLRELTVVRRVDGESQVLATTSSKVAPGSIRLAEQAMARNAALSVANGTAIRSYGVPILVGERLFGAVVLSYSVSSVEQLRRRGRVIVVWFIPIAVVVIALVVDQLAKRIIHRPLGFIRRTMRSVEAGDLSARARIVRADEIGEVGRGLNEMLAQMEGFHSALQEKVSEATGELRLRNRELVESYDRVLALQEALARAERMAAVGQMAANVAHQVGTPLNLISGYVQMILQEEGPDSAVARRLQIVGDQIAKVIEIVRSLLDRARRPSPRRPTDVARMVRRVAEIARPRLDAVAITLFVEGPGELPVVSADEVQLELALLNLISNSLDAMPGGGTIRVAVSQAGHNLRIEVADTGGGIPADLLPHVFEPWVTTKDPGRGTGLGLSITRDVVESHGGSISAVNTAGGGAMFAIELPVVAEQIKPGSGPCIAS